MNTNRAATGLPAGQPASESKAAPGAGIQRVLIAARPVPAIRRRRRPSAWTWWTAAVLLALAGVVGEAWRLSRGSTPIEYATAPVTRGAITRTVTASGSVNPVITIQVGTYVSGPIQDLYCDFNTVVRKGQLCAKIDPRPYAAIVEQDAASLATAKAQLAKDETTVAYAKLTYERTIALRDKSIVSQDQLDSRRSAYDEAAAQVALDKAAIVQKQAALDAAKVNLAFTNIVSPVNGTVISRNVTVGQTVAASFQTPTLFLIATDLTRMQVDANVSESDIGAIAAGSNATFTVEAFPARIFEGRVRQVRQAPQMVQNVVTYDSVITVPNDDQSLKPGMTATVRIVVARRDDVLRVPNQALRYAPSGLGTQRRDGRPTVWVLRHGQPVAVPIVVGLEDDANVEVLQGELTESDQVLTSEHGGAATMTRLPVFR